MTAAPIDVPADAQSWLFEATDICKNFGNVQALRRATLRVAVGEVVGLVGDNGAGKSTLIKTISGVQPADSGSFAFEGREVEIHGPADAANLGLAFVYQDLALCDNLDVVANLFLGREIAGRGPFKRLKGVEMHARTRALLDSVGVRTLQSLRTEVGGLSGGQRQAIAIARAMIGEPQLLVLDEPTAALGVTQTEQVLQLIRRLKAAGHGVILISHNMADVMQVCDRVTVLHLGSNAGDFPCLPEARGDIIAAITGINAVAPEGSVA